MATNGTHQQELKAEQYPATSGPTETASGGASGDSELSKDEVGWYFVEQYYTTLSKSPEKLHVSPKPSLPRLRQKMLMIVSYSMASALNSFLVSKPKLLLSPLDEV